MMRKIKAFCNGKIESNKSGFNIYFEDEIYKLIVINPILFRCNVLTSKGVPFASIKQPFFSLKRKIQVKLLEAKKELCILTFNELTARGYIDIGNEKYTALFFGDSFKILSLSDAVLFEAKEEKSMFQKKVNFVIANTDLKMIFILCYVCIMYKNIQAGG